MDDRKVFPDTFWNVAYTPAGCDDATLAVAACRAGGLGVLNAEFTHDPSGLIAAMDWLDRKAGSPYGLKLDTLDGRFMAAVEKHSREGLGYLILDDHLVTPFRDWIAELRRHRVAVLVETTSACIQAGPLEETADGLILKGNEAGGLVGENSSFILVQHWRRRTKLPLFVRGGVTPCVAAGCAAIGVAGGVLDSQILLLAESPLAGKLMPLIGTLSGNDTVAVGSSETGEYFRLLVRPKHAAAKIFRAEGDGKDAQALKRLVQGRIDWQRPEEGLLPLGQDVCFAGPWQRQYKHLADLFKAVDRAVEQNLKIAVERNPLAQGGALAQELNIPFAVVQGPMARVSDNAQFAAAVSRGGGLPTIALSMSKACELDALLGRTAEAVGTGAWGIGMLGFAPQDLLDEQLAVVEKYKPGLAVIAGGRPEQCTSLETLGIRAFLHVPASELVPIFMEAGAHRFIFEGRECGGHIGPLCSFVLWSQMIDALLLELDRRKVKPEDIHVLFAGGIHDAVSAALTATVAAPLLSRGVKIGIQMGTSYLFTKEIVQSGALSRSFQAVAMNCGHTVCLNSGPGHSSRCAPTPFAQAFIRRRLALLKESSDPYQNREQLEKLILGRLRLASKGCARLDDSCTLQHYDEAFQQQEGMYMLGQVAILRQEPTDIAALHHEVTLSAAALLSEALARKRPARQSQAQPADIAIVGMAALLPGAGSIEAYWENILNKAVAIKEIPPHRWDWRLYYDEDPRARDKIYSRWGGFIEDLLFDPIPYGIPPKSLAAVDPMQILALEVARRTLVDAGYDQRPFDRERASVIIGCSGGVGDVGLQYGLRAELPRFSGHLPDGLSRNLPEWTEDSFAGILPNVVAGRIANRLNLGGVNFTTDAACASSMAALYQAVTELTTGRSDMVITGGVDTSQGPFGYLCFSKTQALSPRGTCETFNAGADGIVISEGIAMAALKRLGDAERDGDRIYAVIKGVGASSDGRSKALTAPEPAGQLRAMQRAYDHAGFGPDKVTLFEAHGTGTVAGDSAELESTTRLLGTSGCGGHHAAIGSVKTLIGHTKATAGIAGIIKVALALHRRILPPHFPVREPIAGLQQDGCPLFLPQEAYRWLVQDGDRRRAAVSAFGFGGTNFHVVLEEYAAEYRPWVEPAGSQNWPVELFAWGAGDRAGLRDQLLRLQHGLSKAPDPVMRQLAFSLARKWRPADAALAFVAADAQDLKRKVDAAVAFLQGEQSRAPQGLHYGLQAGSPGKLAVLFAGQGSQYTDMFREQALHFPILAGYLAQADAILEAEFRSRFGDRALLSRFIFPRGVYGDRARTAAEQALRGTDIAQPALGAVGAGLWELMRWLGLAPDLLGGHSYGEFVALYAGGLLDFPSLMRLSEARGRVIVDAVGKASSGLGTMAAVQACREDVEKTIRGVADLVLANHNAPQQCVISGSQPAVNEALERFRQAGIETRGIPVAAAFHSPLMQPAQAAFAHAIDTCNWRQPPTGLPVYSNTTAQRHSPELGPVKKTLIRHMIEPVEFVRQVQTMYADGARVFLELGPGSVLTHLVRRILGEAPHTAVAVDAGKAGLAGLLNACGQLICAGVKLEIDRLFAARDCQTAIDFNDAAALRPEAAGSTCAWLVNGSSARPLADRIEPKNMQPVVRAAPAKDMPVVKVSAPASNTIQKSTKGHLMSLQVMGSPDPQGRRPRQQFRENTPHVMASYFDTMRVFLQTQERVMAAYLGASPAPTNGSRQNALPPRRGAWTLPEPVLELAPESAQDHSGDAAAPPGPVGATPVFSGPENIRAGQTAAPAACAAPDEAQEMLDQVKLTEILLSIVEKKTGYPKDMLGLDQNLEADLGIDSIKRVEISAALLEALPPVYRQSMNGEERKLSTQKTLNGIVAVLAELQPARGLQRPFKLSGVEAGMDPAHHPLRYVVEAVPEAAAQATGHPLEAGVYVLTRDRLGLAGALSEMLRARACTVLVADQAVLKNEAELGRWCDKARHEHGSIKGIVHLAQAGSDWLQPDAPLMQWQEQLQVNEKSLFMLLNRFSDILAADAAAVSVSAMGGTFSRGSAAGSGMSLQGGAAGLLKSLGRERPRFSAKAIDLDPKLPAGINAGLVLAELELAGGRREVGYPGGRRTIFKTVTAAPTCRATPPPALGGAVILATGGARGITAEALREMAAPGVTLLLTGRSALPEEEPEEFRNLPDFEALRQHFIEQVRSGKTKLKMGQIRQRVGSVLNTREMLLNIQDLRRRGAAVQYLQVDVTDETALRRSIETIYAQHGTIDGVVHGAGIIEDKLLADKDPASWSRVVETKVLGLLLLQKYLRPQGLRFLAVFSSVAGRYGNSGQTDYATANELMNRLCCQLSLLWNNGGGHKVRVKALCWGPWGPTTFGSGMVNAFTQAKFKSQGILLVGAEDGRRLFRDEVTAGDDSTVEIICGHGPWEAQEAQPGSSTAADHPHLRLEGPWSQTG